MKKVVAAIFAIALTCSVAIASEPPTGTSCPDSTGMAEAARASSPLPIVGTTNVTKTSEQVVTKPVSQNRIEITAAGKSYLLTSTGIKLIREIIVVTKDDLQYRCLPTSRYPGQKISISCLFLSHQISGLVSGQTVYYAPNTVLVPGTSCSVNPASSRTDLPDSSGNPNISLAEPNQGDSGSIAISNHVNNNQAN